MADLAAATPKIAVATLSNSVRTRYVNKYVEGALLARIYDQLASPVGTDMSELAKGSAVTVPFLSGIAPSTQVISESNEITPVVLRDATVTVTPVSRGNAILWSEKLSLQTYTDYGAKAFEKVGQNMMESIDLVAQTAALTGSLTKSPAARASLDAGTAGHRISRSAFNNAALILTNMKVPQYVTPRGRKWVAVMHPFVYNDLLADSVILAVGEYQDAGLILNNELGELAGFKLVVTPWAKVFWGAGADNASVVATTLAADVNALATTIVVAANTNIVVGQRLHIGTEETAGTHYATNESVIVSAIDTVNISIIGEGENGGLKYDHSTGAAVRNADSAYPVVFGGPESLGKVYDTTVGEYGKIVGPNKGGILEQWTSLGWKWYGGYGIVAQNRILRSEFSSSMDA